MCCNSLERFVILRFLNCREYCRNVSFALHERYKMNKYFRCPRGGDDKSQVEASPAVNNDLIIPANLLVHEEVANIRSLISRKL